MALDPTKLLHRLPYVVRQVIDPGYCILYALGVGAEDLEFVYEDRLKSLPTMAAVLGYPGFIWRDPSLGVTWEKVVLAEHSIVIHKPLPTVGEIVGVSRFTALYDKGPDKGVIAILERAVRDAGGDLLCIVTSTTMLRGDGGYGGAAEGAPVPHPIPDDRPAELALELPTAPNLALIYRRSGDLNPLHIDPDVARKSGFERPILHGLATYGVVGRALMSALMQNDPTRLTRMDARFSSPVYPGETIRTEIWRQGDGKAAFRAWCVERNRMVLNNGLVEYVPV